MVYIWWKKTHYYGDNEPFRHLKVWFGQLCHWSSACRRPVAMLIYRASHLAKPSYLDSANNLAHLQRFYDLTSLKWPDPGTWKRCSQGIKLVAGYWFLPPFKWFQSTWWFLCLGAKWDWEGWKSKKMLEDLAHITWKGICWRWNPFFCCVMWRIIGHFSTPVIYTNVSVNLHMLSVHRID